MRRSKKILVGNVPIGGDSPVSIQSMTTVEAKDVVKTVAQIKRLEKAGCQIVRVAVPDQECAEAILKIKQKIKIPIVADIHFHYKLAILCIKNGADKIRLNPGNITEPYKIEKVLSLAKKYKVPVRIGLNSGSVQRTHSRSLVDDLVYSGLDYLKFFEKCGFGQTIFSLKTNNVCTTIKAYEKMAKFTDAPLHLGVTATGLPLDGIVKSSIGIGALLLKGIGDTLRVSLSCDPVKEVEVARKILYALNLRNSGIEIISCPTCGRCKIDLFKQIRAAEKKLKILEKKFLKRRLKVAIMGCVVNGPGEAKDADLGIAWGQGKGVLFKKGKKIKTVT
ncbi:MAG: 4-hydroxy-3-methylbut-2-en-1-yl diphosphate synthase, partial [Candidatus Omnitrophota bacterium]